MEKHYIYEGRPVPLSAEPTVRLVVPAKGVTPGHLVADLARTSRLEIDTTPTTSHLVVRGDEAELQHLKGQGNVSHMRAAFRDHNGHELILTDEILVRFDDTQDEDDRTALLKRYGCSIIDRRGRFWRVKVMSQEDEAPLDIANKLAAEPGVAFAEPNFLQKLRPEAVPRSHRLALR